MSAFVVDDAHLQALVSWASGKRVTYWDPEGNTRADIQEREEEVGQLLLDANITAVAVRYQEPPERRRYSHCWDRRHRSPVEILKACGCYDYQACEIGEEYRQTTAARIIDEIRHHAIRLLPGYEEASWEVKEGPSAAVVCLTAGGGVAAAGMEPQAAPAPQAEASTARPAHGWRQHGTHREETTAVRRALRAAGINARVGHDRGTAWGWMEVNIGSGQQWGEHQRDDDRSPCSRECARCSNLRAMSEQAERIVAEVTGRSGDYGGCVNVHTQDHWNQKERRSEPITHPKWRTR